MKTIDLNADIGEAASLEGQRAERDILAYVSSANIACGGHAGNDDTMRETVRAAKNKGVSIGAHPSYPDPSHFGRRSMALGDDKLVTILRKSLTEQIVRLTEIAASAGARVAYVKPHGALYNDAVKSPRHASLIADVIYDIDPRLIFLGGPNSEMSKAARMRGLGFVAEGFIDRRYTDEGHLQNRSVDGAVIKDQAARMAQALSLATQNRVINASGASMTVEAQSLCLHGDSAGAVETARQARKALEAAGLTIHAFADAG